MGLFDFLKKKNDAKQESAVSEEQEKDLATDDQNIEKSVSNQADEVTSETEMVYVGDDIIVTIDEPAYITATEDVPIDGAYSEVKPTTMLNYIEAKELDVTNPVTLLSVCLGKMAAIQGRYSALVVQGRDWNIDLEQGVLTFVDGESYPVQFIGSESKITHTWLWGWYNINQFSDELLVLARQMQAIGEKWQIDPLKQAEHELQTSSLTSHDYAIIACALSEKVAYQVAHHEKGSAFVAVANLAKEVFEPTDVTTFITNAQHCIMNFELDHKVFIESFLMWNDTEFEWHEQTLLAHFEQPLKVEFEEVETGMRIKQLTLQTGE